MKKIIYSLVIMIAAGSLFTSCIAQTELDQSYKDMRDAKARYIDEMRKLKTAEKDYMDALARKVNAEAAYLEAQNELLAATQEHQVKEAKAKADLAEAEATIAAAEAKLREAEVNQKLEEMTIFLSPAMQKAFVAAAMAYYGAAEAWYVLDNKAKTETDPVIKANLEKAAEEAFKAKNKAEAYWNKVRQDVVDLMTNGGYTYIDPTEAIEDLLGALPDDMKSAIMDKILEALASIVD